MSLMKRIAIFLTGALALLWASGGCRVNDHPVEGRKGGKAVIALPGNAESLFPLTLKGYDLQEISNHLLTPALTRANARGDVVPVLVRAWQADPDGRRITYYLDGQKKWSNGAPLRAGDVWRSWRFIRQNRERVNPQYRLSQIDTCIVRDSLTVIFEFTNAVARPARLTRFPVFSRALLHTLDWDSVVTAYTRPFIGCGPFLLREQSPYRLVLTRAPHARTWLDSLEVLYYSDNENLRRLLDRKKVDLAPDVNEEISRAYKKNPAYRTELSGERGYTFIAWNLRSDRVVDLRVRRALTLGLDRATIVDGLLGNLGEVHDAPTYPAFRDYLDTTAYRYDPQQARRLLSLAGAPRRPLRLLVNSENPLRRQLARNIKSYWELTGVETVIKVRPWKEFLNALQKGFYDAALISWVENDFFNPTDLFSSEGIKKGNNFMYYRSDIVDNALMDAMSATDRDARRKAWLRFQRQVIRDMPVTVLFSKRIATLVSRRLKNVKIDASGYLNNPGAWWMESAAKPISGEKSER